MGIFDFLSGGKSDDKEKDWYEKESEKAEKQAEKDYQDSHAERTQADYDRSDDYDATEKQEGGSSCQDGFEDKDKD